MRTQRTGDPSLPGLTVPLTPEKSEVFVAPAPTQRASCLRPSRTQQAGLCTQAAPGLRPLTLGVHPFPSSACESWKTPNVTTRGHSATGKGRGRKTRQRVRKGMEGPTHRGLREPSPLISP